MSFDLVATDGEARAGVLHTAHGDVPTPAFMGRWRGDAVRMSERAGTTLSSLFRELGLITRREYEELELRLAQVEHRLRLVEKKDP